MKRFGLNTALVAPEIMTPNGLLLTNEHRNVRSRRAIRKEMHRCMMVVQLSIALNVAKRWTPIGLYCTRSTTNAMARIAPRKDAAVFTTELQQNIASHALSPAMLRGQVRVQKHTSALMKNAPRREFLVRSMASKRNIASVVRRRLTSSGIMVMWNFSSVPTTNAQTRGQLLPQTLDRLVIAHRVPNFWTENGTPHIIKSTNVSGRRAKVSIVCHSDHFTWQAAERPFTAPHVLEPLIQHGTLCIIKSTVVSGERCTANNVRRFDFQRVRSAAFIKMITPGLSLDIRKRLANFSTCMQTSTMSPCNINIITN